jgi:hypothetical protein
MTATARDVSEVMRRECSCANHCCHTSLLTAGTLLQQEFAVLAAPQRKAARRDQDDKSLPASRTKARRIELAHTSIALLDRTTTAKAITGIRQVLGCQRNLLW